MPGRYPRDVLADDGLALVAHLGPDDYGPGGCSLGARIVLSMLVSGRALVAGQGLASVTGPPGGANRRVPNDLADGREPEPSGADTASWITRLARRTS